MAKTFNNSIYKRLMLAVIGTVTTLSLFACSEIKHSNIPDATVYKQYNNEIVFSLIDDSLTPSGAVFCYKNTGNNTIFWGVEYSVQIKKKNSWYDLCPIVENYDTDAYGLQLTPGATFENYIDWSFLYGNLPNGDYRILIEYEIINPTNDRAIEQNCFMICEFTVTT